MTDWSPQIGNLGARVTDLADIEQCLGIIMATRKGSDPHRPLFGCDAWLWIDRPERDAIPNICREVVDALELWEPRIKVLGVEAAYDADRVPRVTVRWQPLDQSTTKYTEVKLGV